MKTHPSSVLILLAAYSAALVSPLAALPANSTPVTAYRLGAVERYGVKAVQPGDPATKVAAYLGQPDQKLSGDTWVYRRFQCQRDLEQAAECTTLLISFSHGRVTDLQRVNAPAVKAMAAELAARVPTRQIAARK